MNASTGSACGLVIMTGGWRTSFMPDGTVLTPGRALPRGAREQANHQKIMKNGSITQSLPAKAVFWLPFATMRLGHASPIRSRVARSSHANADSADVTDSQRNNRPPRLRAAPAPPRGNRISQTRDCGQKRRRRQHVIRSCLSTRTARCLRRITSWAAFRSRSIRWRRRVVISTGLRV